MTTSHPGGGCGGCAGAAGAIAARPAAAAASVSASRFTSIPPLALERRGDFIRGHIGSSSAAASGGPNLAGCRRGTTGATERDGVLEVVVEVVVIAVVDLDGHAGGAASGAPRPTHAFYAALDRAGPRPPPAGERPIRFHCVRHTSGTWMAATDIRADRDHRSTATARQGRRGEALGRHRGRNRAPGAPGSSAFGRNSEQLTLA
jgi:hypothetical protein